MYRSSRRNAFTMMEVFIVIGIIGMLAGLLLPSVQAARETARRVSCANNFTQVALAMHGYHSAFNRLPMQLSGTDGSTFPGEDNDMRLSALVAIMPFLDQRSLFDRIQGSLDRDWNSANYSGVYLRNDMSPRPTKPAQQDESPWNAGGPSPSNADYGPWLVEVPVLRCPSDPGYGGFGRTNYAMCIGDAMLAGNSGPMKDVNGKFVFDTSLAKQTEASMRGMFVPRRVTRFDDVTDGLSCTIMLAEILTDLGDMDVRSYPMATSPTKLRDHPNIALTDLLVDQTRSQFWDPGKLPPKLNAISSARRGLRWADGMPMYTSVTTILPPNRELVISADRDDAWCLAPPSSRHSDGAHVVFGDLVVKFITNSIDAGSAYQPTVYVGSPNPPGSKSAFGVWGAMGTRASSELAANQSRFLISTD